MSFHQETIPGGRNMLPARLLPLSLLAVLGLFPPETRGESLAGCALLAALLVLIHWQGAVPAGGRWWLVVLLASAWPLLLAADAPGAGIEPLALFFLAGVVGLYAAPGGRWGEAAPWVLATAGFLVGLHAVFQLLWGLEADLAWVEGATGVPDRELVLARLREGRAFSSFATPAAMGGYLSLVLPVTVGLALDRRGGSRLFLLALAGVQAGGILSSASGTAVAALVGAGLLAVGVRRWRWRALGTAAALALLLAAGVIVIRGIRVLDPTREDSPLRLRAGNYRVALEVIGDHPFSGVGPGGFGEVFPRYRGEGDNETRHVHNLPLEMAAELGIPAGGAVSILFFSIFLGPLLRSRRQEAAWRQGLAIGLAAFALHNLADFTAWFPSILWTAALGRALLREDRTEEGPAPRLLGGLVVAGTLAAAFLAVLAGLSTNARFAGRHAAASGEIPLAVSLSERAVRLAPWDVDARLLLTQSLLDSGPPEGAGREERLRSALEHADLAVALSPVRSSARAVRARIRAVMGDTPGAWADMVQAASSYPLQADYGRLRDDLEGRLPRRPPEGAGP